MPDALARHGAHSIHQVRLLKGARHFFAIVISKLLVHYEQFKLPITGLILEICHALALSSLSRFSFRRSSQKSPDPGRHSVAVVPR